MVYLLDIVIIITIDKLNNSYRTPWTFTHISYKFKADATFSSVWAMQTQLVWWNSDRNQLIDTRKSRVQIVLIENEFTRFALRTNFLAHPGTNHIDRTIWETNSSMKLTTSTLARWEVFGQHQIRDAIRMTLTSINCSRRVSVFMYVRLFVIYFMIFVQIQQQM